jgi:hypothetical protein
MHMVIYLSSLIRSVIVMHSLVNNKIRYNEQVEIGFVGTGAEDKAGDGSDEKK